MGMRNLGQEESPRARRPWILRLLLWLVGGVIGIAVVITGAYYFDQYTEGNEFCGLLCHPNEPEYVAHEIQAHASVECGECHIGPGLLPKVTAKIYGVGELVSLITDSYHRPIEPPVARLRPADEICEQCHWPETFQGDSVRIIPHFENNEENTGTQTYLVLRTGGGEVAAERARADTWPVIHWHVENPVSFVALDVEKQEIPWVGLQRSGELVEYVAQDSPNTLEELRNMEREEMDCLDCHNRANHEFVKPSERLDEALAVGLIDRSLPDIRSVALKYLSISAPSQEAGLKVIDGMAQDYQSRVSSLSADQQQSLTEAVEVVKEIYSETIFPTMNVTWEAYPNNIGHDDFPGCFRCHDGQHVNAQEEPIPLNCTTCHSVPLVTEFGAAVEGQAGLFSAIARAEMPESHSDSDFLWEHRILADDSCLDCHQGPIEFGTDNSSFCANSACHEQEWPRVELGTDFTHPVELTGKHAQVACNDCHQGVREPVLDDCSICHEPPAQPHFGPNCSDCHTTEGFFVSAADWVTDVPAVPHRVAGVTECSTCHGEDAIAPYPDTHIGLSDLICTECHEPVVPEGISPVPHVVENRDNCLSCHASDALEPVPAYHVGWPNESCLLCHQPGSDT